MDSNNLKKKAITGVVWSTAQRFSSIFVGFVSGIILARLLTPYDYGCIGMLTIFMVFSSVFIDAGFGTALIQKKRPTQDDYSTVFFWNLGISTVIYFILFFAAPYIALFYRTSILCNVLRVQGLVLIINAFLTIQTNQLNKQFRFKKIAITNIFTSVINLSFTVYLAYTGWGVWALVASNIMTALIPAIVYWLTNKWYPKLVFSIQSFKELFSFGAYMLLTQLLGRIVGNVQGLLIGRIYNPELMGYYSKANSTEQLATKTISDVVMQVTFPLYSELQDSKEMMILAIKKIVSSIAFLSYPLLFLLILLAKPIFILLYSDRWVESIPYFQILCFAGLALCLHGANSQAVIAIGKSKEMFKWSFVKQVVGLICIVGGLFLFGIRGMLAGMVMQCWLVYFVNAGLVSHYIGYKIRRQLLDLAPVMLLSIGSFTVSYVAGLILPYGMYVNAIIMFVIFAATYIGIAKVLKLEALGLCIEMTTPFVNKFFKKK